MWHSWASLWYHKQDWIPLILLALLSTFANCLVWGTKNYHLDPSIFLILTCKKRKQQIEQNKTGKLNKVMNWDFRSIIIISTLVYFLTCIQCTIVMQGILYIFGRKEGEKGSRQGSPTKCKSVDSLDTVCCPQQKAIILNSTLFHPIKKRTFVTVLC